MKTLIFAIGILSLCAVGALQAQVVITPATGFNVTWNGNDGEFFDPLSGAGPPNNLALATNGAVPFTSGDLGPEIAIAFHVAANVNDGLYGNSNSWIGQSAAVAPFYAGVDLGGMKSFRAVAWGRDNGDNATEGQFTDRTLGLYELQVTQDVTVNAASAWTTIATFDYQSSLDDTLDGLFTSYFRHEYVVSTDIGDPINATGLRLVVPVTGLGGGTAIDELEVLANPLSGPPPPPPPPFAIIPAAGFDIQWDGNDGDFFDPLEGAGPPDNLALASNGAMPFSSGDWGPEIGVTFHVAANLNDGLYGNRNSWIGGLIGVVPPFHAGVDLGGIFEVSRIAWGRDNGNIVTDACGGQCTDRTLGLYSIEVTTDLNPGPGSTWTSVGTVDYQQSTDDGPGNQFSSHLRHEFTVSQNGAPITATGVRLVVSNPGTAIDELEVYGPLPSALPIPVNPLPILVLLPLVGIYHLRKRGLVTGSDTD